MMDNLLMMKGTLIVTTPEMIVMRIGFMYLAKIILRARKAVMMGMRGLVPPRCHIHTPRCHLHTLYVLLPHLLHLLHGYNLPMPFQREE